MLLGFNIFISKSGLMNDRSSYHRTELNNLNLWAYRINEKVFSDVKTKLNILASCIFPQKKTLLLMANLIEKERGIYCRT